MPPKNLSSETVFSFVNASLFVIPVAGDAEAKRENEGK